MSINILMPALSPTMEAGTLAKWLKKVGDEVKCGDILAEIETDKATMELESIEDGVLAKILVPEGSCNVKINSPIAILAQEGEDINNDVVPETVTISSAEAPVVEKPKEEVMVKSAPISSLSVGKNVGKKIFISPLARRIAKDNNIDLSSVLPTGPHGRIVKRDVEACLQNKPIGNKTVSSASDSSILQTYHGTNYELIPHNTMRKVIAKRLTESKQNVPHFYVSVDCEMDKLLKLRSEFNASIAEKNPDVEKPHKISINDMIIKASALALNAVPQANVSWLEESMIQHKNVNIAVAVAIPDGLITPIVNKAEEKSLFAISKEMKDLILRAKERRLKPEEYQGGSASISNLGMYGVKNFSAIVNPPQSVIFAVSASRQQPIIKENNIIIGNIMSVTISVDHRAIDGAVAAQLIQAFKSFIENPMTMLL